jgi:hypothetical protein
MPAEVSGDGSGRPTDWWVLGLTGDPVPQNCDALGLAGDDYRTFADTILEARRGAVALLADPAVVGWLGKSGEAFRSASAPFPGMLDTAAAAYREVGDAYTAAATAIGAAQKQVDGLASSALGEFENLKSISGLPDDKARMAATTTNRLTLDGIVNSFAGPSMTPSIYSNVVDSWMAIQRQRSSLDASLRDYATAKTRWTSTLQDATDRAHRITKLFTNTGQSSMNFGERFTAFGGSVADLVLKPDAGGADLLGAEIPPPGTDASSVAGWWSRIDPAKRQWLQQNQPALLGNLDGLPFDVRDKANRAQLDAEKARITAELAQIAAGHLPTGMDAFQIANEVERDHNLLKGIEAIQQREALFAGKNPPTPFYVVGFDTQGSGHAVFCVGDPTKAKNLAITVPGTGTDLSWSDTYIDIADKTRVEADSIGGPTDDTASIYWQGYTAPPSILPDAAYQNWADTGQAQLARFVAGLSTATNPNAHLTVVGHSYGSTVVGLAAARSGMHPNDIVFLASPGVGVDNASELGLDPKHVWAGHIEGDPINYSPPLDPFRWSPFDPHERYGTDPTDPSFGGEQIWCQNNPLDPANHMAYWDDGSSSLHNIGAIISGHTEQLYGPTETLAPGPFPAKPLDPRSLD